MALYLSLVGGRGLQCFSLYVADGYLEADVDSTRNHYTKQSAPKILNPTKIDHSYLCTHKMDISCSKLTYVRTYSLEVSYLIENYHRNVCHNHRFFIPNFSS